MIPQTDQFSAIRCYNYFCHYSNTARSSTTQRTLPFLPGWESKLFWFSCWDCTAYFFKTEWAPACFIIFYLLQNGLFIYPLKCATTLATTTSCIKFIYQEGHGPRNVAQKGIQHYVQQQSFEFPMMLFCLFFLFSFCKWTLFTILKKLFLNDQELVVSISFLVCHLLPKESPVKHSEAFL